MRRRWCLWAVLVVVVSLAPGTPGRADHRPVAPAQAADQAIEAGPEDGFLCCSGWIPFLFHGEKVLTSTGRAGVFRSEARGEHWQRSMIGLVAPNGVSGFVGHVCQAASAPHVVYALAGAETGLVPFAGLFSSEDFGRTWNRRGSVSTSFGFGTCAVDADTERTVYVRSVFDRQTWRSVDGGATFDVLPVPGCAAGAPVVPRRGVLYVDGGHGCRYFSTDGGATYSALGEPPSSGAAGGGGFAVSPDGRTIFISTTDERSGVSEVFRSTDRGASYTAVTGLPGSVHQEWLAFDSSSPARIYASTSADRRLFVSSDGGSTFAMLPASTDPRFVAGTHAIDVDDRGSLYVDSLGGPFRSDDGGATFTSLLNGFRASSVNNLAVDANGKLLVAVNNTRGVFRQTQGLDYRPIADTLPRTQSGGASIVTAVAGSPSDAEVVVAATSFGQGGVFWTTDGGATWKRLPGAPAFTPQATRMAFPTGERAYLVSPTAASLGSGLYRLDLGAGGGGTAVHLSGLRFGALAVDPTDPDVLFVGTYFHNAGLFKSTDGGRTLQDLGQPGSYSALVIDRDDRQVIYAGQQFGHVLRSRDGGRSFTPASEGLTGAGVLGLAQDVRGTLFAWVRGGGLFASQDQGSSWYAVDTGEALTRSGVEAGRASLVAHPTQPGLVYLGNAGVIRVQADAGVAPGRH